DVEFPADGVAKGRRDVLPLQKRAMQLAREETHPVRGQSLGKLRRREADPDDRPFRGHAEVLGRDLEGEAADRRLQLGLLGRGEGGREKGGQENGRGGDAASIVHASVPNPDGRRSIPAKKDLTRWRWPVRAPGGFPRKTRRRRRESPPASRGS